MKKVKTNDIFYWKGNLARVIGYTSGRTFISIEMLDPDRCPHCHGYLEKRQFDVVEGSPLFEENAKPVETIVEEPTV